MKKSGSESSIGYSIDMNIDPIYCLKDGWRIVDIEATKKQPVKLVVEIRTRKSTVKLSCTTRDLKVKEIVRRKRKAKKAKPAGDAKSVANNARRIAQAGITGGEAGKNLRIMADTHLKVGDESEQQKSPENIQ